jgi:hypothetical protein
MGGWRHQALIDKAAFDHGCPEGRVLVLRESYRGGATVDLDVCGRVRRYQDIGDADRTVWVDVTNAYPPSSLPPPAPPGLAREGSGPALPRGPVRCQTNLDCLDATICFEGWCRR